MSMEKWDRDQLMQIQSQECKMAYLGDPEAVPEPIELAGCVGRALLAVV
jgi:hypothetical protein